MDEEYEAIILRTVEFLLEEPLVERELLNWFARGRLAVLHRVEIAEGDAVGKDDVSLVFTAAVAGFSINTKRIWSRRSAIGSTNSAVTPKAAVNHTEFALSSIRRPYQPSNSAVLRGENSRAIDFSEMTSAGLGVSAMAPSLATARSGSVVTSFQYSKYCFAVAESATR